MYVDCVFADCVFCAFLDFLPPSCCVFAGSFYWEVSGLGFVRDEQKTCNLDWDEGKCASVLDLGIKRNNMFLSLGCRGAFQTVYNLHPWIWTLTARPK